MIKNKIYYLRISKDLDILLLYLIMFQAFLGNFFYLAGIIEKVISVIIIGRFIFLMTEKRNAKKNVYLCFGVMIFWLSILILNAVFWSSYTYLQSNFNAVLYAISVCTFIIYLLLQKQSTVVDLFVRNFRLINLYAIINCIIIFIQSQGNYFLIDISRTTNPFYVDHVTGLQGLDSTNCLCLIWAFIVIYNFSCVGYCSKNRKRKIKIYNAILLFLTLYVSTLNDSKFYYFFIVFVLIIYYILKAYWEKRLTNKILTFFVLAIILMVVFNVFGDYILMFAGDAGNSVLRVIDSITHIDLSDTSQNTERISILIYAYNNGNFWGFGKGVGEYSFYSVETAFGLGKGQTGGYWGTANLGPFLYAFGVYITIGLIVLMSWLFAKPLASNKKVEWLPFFCSFVLLLLMVFYNKIFTHQRLMIDYCLIYIAMIVGKNAIENNINIS